jgi:hypothetical protein
MSTITIHRYQSGEGGIFANAYLVETARPRLAPVMP